MADVLVHAKAVQMVRLEDLRGYEANARIHDDAQVEALARVMQEHGFTNPLLIDAAGVIIAGHGRMAAAQRLGMDAVPCITVKGLSEAQVKALRISDNQIALRSGWNLEVLRLELGEIKTEGLDLTLSGFDRDALRELFAQPRRVADPDAAPEPPAQPVTIAGDVWLMGPHRIICGDCTVAATVEAVLAGAVPNLMVTDPPYGVEYDPGWRQAQGLAGAGTARGAVMNDDRADWREAWALFPGNIAYVWHAGTHAHEVVRSLESVGLLVRSQIVWAKTQLVISRGHYHVQHEPCWYAVRHRARASWTGDRKQATVWTMDHRRSETGHGTQKPIDAMRRPIENNSKPGDAVYEPFSGSGTTIIAAEMMDRVCHAIELSEAYVDVAVLRWEAYTGKAATLAGTDKTFAKVRAERKKP